MKNKCLAHHNKHTGVTSQGLILKMVLYAKNTNTTYKDNTDLILKCC